MYITLISNTQLNFTNQLSIFGVSTAHDPLIFKLHFLLSGRSYQTLFAQTSSVSISLGFATFEG